MTIKTGEMTTNIGECLPERTRVTLQKIRKTAAERATERRIVFIKERIAAGAGREFFNHASFTPAEVSDLERFFVVEHKGPNYIFKLGRIA